MPISAENKVRARFAVFGFITALIAGGVILWMSGLISANHGGGHGDPGSPGNGGVTSSPRDLLKLVPGKTDSLQVPENVWKTLGVKSSPVSVGAPPKPLQLAGRLFIDSTRVARVHSRFSGEIVSIGTHDCVAVSGVNDGKPKTRPLRYGDAVKKDQLLAVVWSKEIGEKKSELVDAISKLRLDKDVMNRLEKLEKGVVSERVVREAERNFEADLIAVTRAERTLRSWHLTEAEIAQVRQEAERVEVRQLKSDPDTARKWAQMELRAPFDGVLLDMKAAIGEIVDSTDELAKVADLRTLSVIAHIYEDDLPLLERLTPEQRKWTVVINGSQEQGTLQGEFGLIGEVIDPMQHTASVIGWVPNEDRKLRIGQFITATIPLPADSNEVSIPAGALLEDGINQYVYVVTDKNQGIVTRRSVEVTRRDTGMICVRIAKSGNRNGPGLTPGEDVVSAGVVELNAGLADLLVKARDQETPTSAKTKNTPVPAD